MASKTFKQDIILTDTKSLMGISSSYRDEHEKGCIGAFGINIHNSDYRIYEMNDNLRESLSDVKLKENQFLFHCQTDRMRDISGAKPIVKFDLNTEMVYFLDMNRLGSDDLVFERKGEKLRYMKSLLEKFNTI